MKNKISLIAIILFPFYAHSQDAIVYEEWYQNGASHSLTIGSTITFTSGTSGPSVDILSANAAVKIRRIPLMSSCQGSGSHPENYFYTEIDEPFVGESEHYNNILIEVSCVNSYLPQPNIFIPIDRTDIHPSIPMTPLQPAQNSRMLMLRKANFWDNSEAWCGIHGPYEELTLNVCSTSVMQFSYSALVANDSLWHPYRIGGFRNLPGAAYDADMLPFIPDPRNEWMDNWWGTYYSNCALFNWTSNNISSVAVIIAGADPDAASPEDVLGRAVIDSSWDGCILIKCRHYGWLVLENKTFGSGASETSVDVADSYLNLNWDGDMIENQYGPYSDLMGTPYHPFHGIDSIEANVPGTIIGVLGDGRISASSLGTTDLTVPMTYIPAAPQLCDTYSYIIDWDGTINTSVSELEINELEFTVFPNPFKDIINVKFNAPNVIRGRLNIYDMLGNIVKSQNVKSQNISIEISGINSGIYILGLEVENTKVFKKIIKL